MTQKAPYTDAAAELTAAVKSIWPKSKVPHDVLAVVQGFVSHWSFASLAHYEAFMQNVTLSLGASLKQPTAEAFNATLFSFTKHLHGQQGILNYGDGTFAPERHANVEALTTNIVLKGPATLEAAKLSDRQSNLQSLLIGEILGGYEWKTQGALLTAMVVLGEIVSHARDCPFVSGHILLHQLNAMLKSFMNSGQLRFKLSRPATSLLH